MRWNIHSFSLLVALVDLSVYLFLIIVLITCVTGCLLCVCMLYIYLPEMAGILAFGFLDVAVVVVASEIQIGNIYHS